MPGELHALSVAIGTLQAKVETLETTAKENRDDTICEHRKVHDIVVATNEAVRNLAKTVEEMKPLTDDYRERRAEARGAAKLAGFLYTLGGGSAALIIDKTFAYLNGRFHP